MDYLVERIALYLGESKVEDIRDKLKNDIVIHCASSGHYIETWNEETVGVAKPTDTQLESYSAEAQTMYELDQAQLQRAKEYPSIGEQLDMQYWDAVNGTTTWKDTIAQVKADNPKPE